MWLVRAKQRLHQKVQTSGRSGIGIATEQDRTLSNLQSNIDVNGLVLITGNINRSCHCQRPICSTPSCRCGYETDGRICKRRTRPGNPQKLETEAFFPGLCLSAIRSGKVTHTVRQSHCRSRLRGPTDRHVRGGLSKSIAWYCSVHYTTALRWTGCDVSRCRSLPSPDQPDLSKSRRTERIAARF